MKNRIIYILLFIVIFSANVFGQNETPFINELMQKGQYAQVLSELEKMNTGDSTQLDILQKQAICNLKLGRLPQARKLYQTVLLRTPESPEILLQIASIYEKEYNLLETLKAYQKL